MLASTKAKILAHKKQARKKQKKAPQWLFPHSFEREYNKILQSLVTLLNLSIKAILLPEIPSMIHEVSNKTPVRTDDFLDRLSGLIFYLRRSMQEKVESTIKGAEGIGIAIARYNRKQLAKINESMFGIDLFLDEPYLEDQLKLFSKQNADLITDIVDHELDQVAEVVERGLQEGSRFTTVATEISKTFGIDARRARTIARDQTAKLNASLTRLRQEEIGVEEYVWKSSNDERVRPTHRANAGKTFRWDTPPPITGHPGHDVNCRCIASPVLDKLLQ